MLQSLKGQNFRITQKDETTGKYLCFGGSTSCSVNYSSSTDDAVTKDVIGAASRPTVTSQSVQISVDAMNVTNMAALLAGIKSMQPFTLIWDEVSTTDNQTPVGASFSRKCQAFLNDLSFSLNDRETCTASLQFQSTGAVSKVTETISYEEISAPAITKGQYVRLFLGSDNTTTPAAVVGASKSLSVHVSVSLEDSTTKDTDGGLWTAQEPTGISFDISANALVRSGDTITSAVEGQSYADILEIFEAGTPVKFQIANVSGANQRTKGSVIMSGSVIISSLNVSAQVKTSVAYDATLTGYGDYTVGTPSES